MSLQAPGPRPAWAQELHRVTHDLRSPLASVAGYADLLHRRVYGELNESQARAVEAIHRRTEDLKKRLDGFADWLYLMTGEPIGEPSAVDVTELVRGEAERIGCELQVVSGGELALAVEGPLGVAIRELLFNAQAAGTGPVSVTIRAETGRLIVDICDDGPGPGEALVAGETLPEGGVARARGWLAKMEGTLTFIPASPRGTVARMSLLSDTSESAPK